MKLNSLPKIKIKSAKRLGRGPGSGKGKTATRGTKGQNARSKLSITHSHYEGGQRPLIKRLPHKKGKRNKSISKKTKVLNTKTLNLLPKKSKVDIETLIKFGIIKKNGAKRYKIKVLGEGKLENSLIVQLPVSKNALQKINKAGGKVEVARINSLKVKKKIAQKNIHEIH